jgi:hypothetical protein
VDDRDRWERLLAETASEHSSACQRICELCVRTLDVTGGGISVVTATGNRGVVCATDDIAARIEDLQFTLGEGPCVDAVAAGSPILIPDLTEFEDIAVERWPAFLEGAGAAGVMAVFALPMRIGAISVGVMDLYRDRPGDLAADDLSAALLAADAAALALMHLDPQLEGAFTDDLGARSSYQMQVHQATGMVQVQADVKTEEAFLLLRARAFSTGMPLIEIAVDVVERRLRFSKEEL